MPSRLAYALAFSGLVLTACHKSKGSDKPTGGSATVNDDGTVNSPNARRVTFSFGLTQQADKAEVFLQSTDERGSTTSHSLGMQPGTCVVGAAAPEMNAILQVTCKTGATGTQLQLVVSPAHDGRLLVMKLRADDGVKLDPMARTQVDEAPIPLGAAVDAAAK